MSSKGAEPVAPLRPGCEKATPWSLVGPNPAEPSRDGTPTARGVGTLLVETSAETHMSPTIRSLVVPVSDMDAARAVNTALFGAPHTDQPYYVGFNVDGFEVSLAPNDPAGNPIGLRGR
jgi:hypothetical protein